MKPFRLVAGRRIQPKFGVDDIVQRLGNVREPPSEAIRFRALVREDHPTRKT
jgi:hypothetical protein